MGVRYGDRPVTVPDFAYPDAPIAVFCDAFAFRGNPDTLELGVKKRSGLQSKDGGEWTVLPYGERTIQKSADAGASEVAENHRKRTNHGRTALHQSPSRKQLRLVVPEGA